MTVAVGIDVAGDAHAPIAVDESGTIVARTLQTDGASRLGVAVRDPFEAGLEQILHDVTRSSAIDAAPRIIGRGTAVALGEQWRGAARGARHVVALTLMDRVYAGMVVDGHPFEGAHRRAGAAGWLALNPVDRDDYRKRGCLESEIGVDGIVRRLVWRIKAGDESRVLDDAGGNMAAITVQHVFDGARAGDGVSIAVIRDTARYIGMAVANLVAIADPDVVVLGGLIAEAADVLLEPARTEALRRISPAFADSLTIAAAALGADAAPLGAARAALLA